VKNIKQVAKKKKRTSLKNGLLVTLISAEKQTTPKTTVTINNPTPTAAPKPNESLPELT
jgi:hypothetical protein